MSEDVIMLFEVELTPTDLEVAPIEHQYVEWLPAQDQHPLSEIELSHRFLKLEQIRRLDVLLNYLLLCLFVGDDFSDRPRAVDPNASRVIARFHYPQVVLAVYSVELGVMSQQLPIKFEDPKLIESRDRKLPRDPVLDQTLVILSDLALLIVVGRVSDTCVVLKLLRLEVALREQVNAA